MALPKIQNPLDWTTQAWNIALGRRLDPDADGWLLGPIGDIGGIADAFVARIAEEEDLIVRRNEPGAGLVETFEGLDGVINARIAAFYERTADYDLDVWTGWKPVFGSFGWLVAVLFSRRIQQLNLPRRSMDTALGMKSDIIHMVDATGRPRYRIWFRRLKKTGEVVYSGIYTTCQIPSGEWCVKVVFPLPKGNATVVMRMGCDDDGNLKLESKGRDYGDPGFYFLVEDRKGLLWKHYIPSFHETIFVYEDDDRALRADHSMSLWNLRAYDLHYKMTERAGLKVC